MRRALLLLLFVVGACGKREAPAPTKPAAAPPAARDAQTKTIEAAPPAPPPAPPIDRDLPKIVESKELRVLFTFNSTGYFIYRGATMGYEYELLSLFAREQKLKLRPVVVRDSRTLFDQLNAGDGDVVAAQVVAGAAETRVAFTSGLYETAPVVVQRKGELPATPSKEVAGALARERRETPDPQGVRIRARLIAEPKQLAGERVHLPRTSPYRARLMELSDELTNDIEVVEVDASTDQLIQQLSEGDIAYTVAAENVAALKVGEYSNLLVKPAVGPPQQVVWAVRTNAPALRAKLDEWIAAKRKSGLLNVLYRKYFLDRRGFVTRAESRYLTAETGRLSPYDDWFREYSSIPGWDWRLVASQSYQESRFNPRARSWAGAAGLMQIMPATARELRINASDPRQSIEGACRYLWKLDQHWKVISRESERIKFILASYNVGTGHVEDARRLAKKFGDDADDWDDVSYWLIRKSKRSVYNDPVVKYGFARGTEPVTYVDLILDRYEHYRAFVKAEPDVPAAPPATTPAETSTAPPAPNQLPPQRLP
ncbi:MAG TPA: transporter substrate-binding domain-containing protein [Thermoanaerobaculia bacterium]|nr:transporter substrate-binding domain-containing protein [Thermoanaerobaculia bacterium]